MKFRDKVTAILYDSMEDVPCPDQNIPCEKCPLYPKVGKDCLTFCRQHPEEAARLMGCDFRYCTGDKVVLVTKNDGEPGPEVGTTGIVWNDDWKVVLVEWYMSSGQRYPMEIPIEAVRLYIPGCSDEFHLPAYRMHSSDMPVYQRGQLTPRERNICEALHVEWVSRGVGDRSVSLWRKKPIWTGKTLKTSDPKGIVADVDADEFPSIREGTVTYVYGLTFDHEDEKRSEQ